jgi:hypothetical protein
MMVRQISVWVNMASPVMIAPWSGSVFSRCNAAVISLASGATANWPITPCSDALNAASR